MTAADDFAYDEDTPMPDTMRVRLYWLDGRVEEPKGEVDAATTVIVRQSGTGHRHFIFAEEIDDEGFAIFWEDEDAPPGPARTDDG